jgi:hypothetical protein
MERSNLKLVPRRLELVDARGEHLMWCDEDLARKFLKARKARMIRKRGRTHLVAIVGAAKFGSLTGGRGTAMDKTRYSHNHETRDNPEKVWTLKRLPSSTREIFRAVVDDCLAA